MNIEQERADFESWLYLDQTKYDPERMSEQEIEIAKIAYQAGRAALQSKPIESAAREIALWAYGEVGADPELTPGLAQLLHHFGISDDVPVALQSQEYTAAIGEAGQAYMDSFKYAHPLPAQFRWSELWEVMYAAANEGFPQSQDREDAERVDFLQKEWFWQNSRGCWTFSFNECWDAGQHDSLRAAIDHARRIEGGNHE